MPSNTAPPDVDNKTLFLSLSDEERREALDEMRNHAQRLGCRIDRKPLPSNDFGDFVPSFCAHLSLN